MGILLLHGRENRITYSKRKEEEKKRQNKSEREPTQCDPLVGSQVPRRIAEEKLAGPNEQRGRGRRRIDDGEVPKRM